MSWSLRKLAKNVVEIRVEVSKRTDWEQWVLLRSDVHHDNPKCNQALERKHLDEAVEYNAPILDNGDLHCVMQGRWDKRADKSALRPEHQGNNYFDLIVETAAEFYKPYLQHDSKEALSSLVATVVGSYFVLLPLKAASRIPNFCITTMGRVVEGLSPRGRSNHRE